MVYVWALDRVPSDERQTWSDGLNDPLPGESAAIADAAFDDSYDQIHQ